MAYDRNKFDALGRLARTCFYEGRWFWLLWAAYFLLYWVLPLFR